MNGCVGEPSNDGGLKQGKQNPSADGPAAASPSAASGHEIWDATLVALAK